VPSAPPRCQPTVQRYKQYLSKHPLHICSVTKHNSQCLQAETFTGAGDCTREVTETAGSAHRLTLTFLNASFHYSHQTCILKGSLPVHRALLWPQRTCSRAACFSCEQQSQPSLPASRATAAPAGTVESWAQVTTKLSLRRCKMLDIPALKLFTSSAWVPV